MKYWFFALLLQLSTTSAVAATACPSGTVYSTGDAATFVSLSVPDSMIYGDDYTVAVSFCNSGSTTWKYVAPPANGSYVGTTSYIRLGAILPAGGNPWGVLRADLSPGDSIAPGAVKTFTFKIAAPTGTSSTVRTTFQWGMVRERVTWFGAAPAVPVDSFATPAVTLQNTPRLPPAKVNAASLDFTHFSGANVINQSYVQAGNNHRSWIPNASQMASIAATASAMGVNYFRIPVVIPPDVQNREYVASEWYAPAGAANANQINVDNVINATQTALNVAKSYGIGVIVVLDGYTEYDAACNNTMKNGTTRLWKKSFDSVKSNAAQIVQALSSNSGLFAWDLMNEPLWNASAFGCLDTSPDALDRATQVPQLALPATANATEKATIEVVEAVHAMYNLVRAYDPYSHPTTVGEGRMPFLHYWNDITSFASPHLYLSPKALLQAQVAANHVNPSTLQVRQSNGLPIDGTSWHVSDPLFQSVLPSEFAATVNLMQSEVDSSKSIPLVIGEFGANTPGDVANVAEQAAYFNLTLTSPAGSLQSLGLGNLVWDMSEGNEEGSDFSIINSAGKPTPSGCTLAAAHGRKPSGC